MAINWTKTGTHYVAKNGNDAAIGGGTDTDLPLLTIGAAIAVSSNSNATTIVIGEGIYEESLNSNSRNLIADGEVILEGINIGVDKYISKVEAA